MTESDALSLSRPARAALAVVCLGYAMVVVDTTAVNVGLPAIGAGFHAGPGLLQWVVDAYVVVFAALLVSGGSAGDRLGSARAFRAGIVLFTLASAACALAPSVGLLVTARAVQGAGAALLAPSAVALISQVFPGQAARARATAVFVTAAGSPQAFGPVLGGIAVGALGWRAVFWINVPLAAVTLALAYRRLPPGPRRRAPLNPAGQLSLALMSGGLITVLIEGPQGQPGATLAAAAVALTAAGAFASVQRSSPNPPVPRQLLQARRFGVGVLSGAAVFAAYYGMVFAVTLDLQDTRHLTPLETGVAFLASALPIFALPALTAPLSLKLGPRRLMLTGAVVLAVGGAAVATPAANSLAALEAGLLLLGTGVGLMVAPQVSVVMSAVPQEAANVASGILNAGRQCGSALGVAIIGAVYAAHGGSHLGWAGTASMAVALLAVALIASLAESGAGERAEAGRQRHDC